MSVQSTIRAWLKPPYFRRTVKLFSVEHKKRDRELFLEIRAASDGHGGLCCPYCECEMMSWWSLRKIKGIKAQCYRCNTRFLIYAAGYAEIL